MKTMRNLFLLCAGLSLFACSSDDDATQQFPEGEGRVEVRIVPPTVATRTTTTASTGTTLKVSGTYTVTLSAVKGGGEKTFSASSNESTTVTFNNVISPTKVVVTLNDGAANYTTSIEENLSKKGATEVPAYGETTVFEEKTTGEGDESVTKYTASVKMAIPVARLEIGTIKFSQTNSVFDVLTVGGVYLDKLRDRGGEYNSTSGLFECKASATPINYQFGSTKDLYGTGDPAVLKDDASGSFVGESKVTLPSSGVYAYNFYGATPGTTYPTGDGATYSLNPQFKIYFSETSLSNSDANEVRYAMIKNYKKQKVDENGSVIDGEYENIVLENGKIYQIIGVDLYDKNIITDEEGTVNEYDLEVTVTEAVWTIEQIKGDWAE